MPDNFGDERAIAEWMIVKREILESHYQAAEALALYIRNKARGEDGKSKADFIQKVIEIYLKIHPKIKKKDAEKAEIKKLEDYLLKRNDKGGNPEPKMKEYVTIYFILQDIIEHQIGITKIEIKQTPASRAFSEGTI